MYLADVSIRGLSPILQHRFAPATLEGLMQSGKKSIGKADYSMEWMETMYVNSGGLLFQPASHIEGAMVKAAARFKIPGGNRRTYKDVVRAYAYVKPDEVLHLYDGQPIAAPDESLLTNPNGHLSVSIMRVVVVRAAVARARLQINEGWQLDFQIEVIEEQLQADILESILSEAGRAVGIGDFRPRYGRFEVVSFST